MLPDTSLGFAPTENGLNHSGDFNWEFPRKSIKPIFKEAAAEALRNTRGFGYFLGQVTQALVSGRLSAPDTVVLAGLIGFPVSPALLGGFHIEDLNQSPAIVQPAEPEQWGKPTATSTRTPVPTYTPNPTRTPEATPTPQPIEIPIIGENTKKPSKQAQYLKMNGPAYVRADTGITSSGILLQKGEPIITTGHTITDTANSKFFWYEIVQFNLDGTPIFGNMRSDALNTQNSTMSERIAAELKYGIFADTAPLSRPTSITQLIRNQTAVGGSTEEAARAKSIIDAYWGEPVATDPYNAFKGAIAHAANSPDSEDPTNINPAISPTMYTIIHSDQSVVVYALNINNEGFIHIKSAPNTQGVQQIESMSVVSWSLLVKEEGLEKAQKIAKQVLGVDLSGNSKNVRDFSSALIRNRFFDYGKPVPVQPTATTTPTAPKAPTATPRSEVEKVEEVHQYESTYTTPDGVEHTGHTVDMGSIRITSDNDFIKAAFETTANSLYGDFQPDKNKGEFVGLNPHRSDALQRTRDLAELVRQQLKDHHTSLGNVSFEDIVQQFIDGKIPLNIVLLKPSGMKKNNAWSSVQRGGTTAPNGLPFMELNSGFVGVGNGTDGTYAVFYSPFLTDEGALIGRGSSTDFVQDALGAAANISKYGDRFSIGQDATGFSDKLIKSFYYDIETKPDSILSFNQQN